MDKSLHDRSYRRPKAGLGRRLIDFKLQLARRRNVKAARAVLADHDNDVDKLKAEEPWLFTGNNSGNSGNSSGGTTGLPNAGTATDDGKQLRRWRKMVGLTDKE